MPPPLAALAALARLEGRAVEEHVLYELLRREQGVAASERPDRSATARILDFAQAAYGDLVGLLCGRDDEVLETARDGEWTLRDILRHAIAVELRYAAQVEYSASRSDDDPIPIRPELLPCDRLSPPEPEYASSRTGGISELLSLLGKARERTDTRLGAIPDAALPRPSVWGTRQVDVRTRVQQIGAHLVQTTVQIEKTVDTRGEARAILRRCCAIRGMHERWSDSRDRSVLDASYRALVSAM